MAHRHEDARLRRIVPCARDRAEHPIRQRAFPGRRVAADGREVFSLPLVFPRNPPGPLLLERATEDASEIRSEVAPAPLAAVERSEEHTSELQSQSNLV